MGKILIITGNDEIRTEEYHDFMDIQKSVGGTFSIFSNIAFKPSYNKKLHLLLHCNDEFLLIDGGEFDRINAVTCLIDGGNLIYGDVAVLIDAGEGESRGFTDEEANAFMNWLNGIIQNNGNLLSKIHAEYDGNKPEPEFKFISF